MSIYVSEECILQTHCNSLHSKIQGMINPLNTLINNGFDDTLNMLNILCRILIIMYDLFLFSLPGQICCW